MPVKLYSMSIWIFVLLFLSSCSFVTSPEKLSDTVVRQKSNLYNLSNQTLTKKETKGENTLSMDDGKVISNRQAVSGKNMNNDVTAQDVMEPVPLNGSGNSMGESAAGSSISSRGILPALSEERGGTPVQNLNKLEMDEIVHLDYEQIEFRTILEEIADTLGITLVIDPSIRGKVTMRTSRVRPLHKKDLWKVLQLLSSEFGVTLEKKGGIYHATAKAVLLPGQVGLTTQKDSSPLLPGKSLQFIALENISQETALPVLSALVEPYGKVLILPGLNVIGIIAESYIQDRIRKLLPLLDADPFKTRGIRLFRLSHAKSGDVAKDLQKVLKLIEGEKTTYSVVNLERLNSILVVAPPQRGFADVQRWVSILDGDSGRDMEQVFVYHVKNLQAKNLAATLTDTFSPNKGQSKKSQVESVKNQGKKNNNSTKNNKTAQVAQDKQENRQLVSGTAADIHLNIVADEDTNSLLVRSTPRDYRQLLQTIKLLDTPPLEVMCNIVIAEVLLNENHQFGIDWYLLSKYGDALLGTPFDITNGGELADAANRGILDTGMEITGTFNKTGMILKGVGGGQLGFVLNMLSSTGNIKVLSRPSILVRNNKEAVIKVGTEEPTLTSVTNSDIISGGQTAIQNDIQYRDTGIILTVKPHITKDGIINMDVDQEISKLGEERTVYKLPSFDSSKLKTSVVVQNGTAIILGGIIRTQKRLSKDGIPLLSDLPVLGPLFATTKNEDQRYELILIIVPEIVNPQNNNSTLVQSFFQQMNKVAKLIDEEMGKNNFIGGHQ